MDIIKVAVKGFWLVFVVATLVTLLAIFAPNVLPQNRFVSGIPISFPERIDYPAGGVSALPTCNSRNAGKTYLFNNSLYSSATCDGAGTWDHFYMGSIPVTPPDINTFTGVGMGGTATVTTVNGAILLSEGANGAAALRCQMQAYPGVAFQVEMGFITPQVNADFHGAGFVIRDSATARLETFDVSVGRAGIGTRAEFTVFTWVNLTTGNALVTGPPIGSAHGNFWVEYTDNTVNRMFMQSQDFGQSYNHLLTEASGTWVANPDEMGFVLNVQNVSCPNEILVYHWKVTLL